MTQYRVPYFVQVLTGYIGNSLEYVSYKTDIGKICRGLDRWTKSQFYTRFKNAGSVLPIGAQQDGISCGVCVLNALEHEIFVYP